MSLMKNLYIHIPFCKRKCSYCAFYSATASTALQRDAYIERVGEELQRVDTSQFETIYTGGGTPTLLETAELEKLLKILHKKIDFSKIKEFSIESNPETLTLDKIILLQDYGVSRLSMGVQSFMEKHRLTLGRITAQKAVENAVKLLQSRPFKHFNIDLIYGIPAQTLEDFCADLKHVYEAGCDHFSAYNLTLEEQTELAGDGIELDEEAAVEMYQAAGDFKPYCRYEISNYALDENSQCLHNRNIWRGETLLGIGPAAASFDGVDRWTQIENLERFMQYEVPEIDRISAEERQKEIFLVNLRTVEGWSKAMWEKKFPFSWEKMLQKSTDVAKLYDGCFETDETSVRLSDKGLLFWNEISMEFL